MTQIQWLVSGVVLAALGTSSPAPAQAAKGTLAASYVLLGGDGIVARAVYTGDADRCPKLDIDGKAQPMARRDVPAALAEDFPILVCEAAVPADTKSAALDGQALPLPPKSVKTVAGIGDTGCRLKAAKSGQKGKSPAQAAAPDDEGKFQDCNDPVQWPFAALARAVADARPDLVVHVGDYVYRESKCPKGDSGCEGSPHKHDWATWAADFFSPAAPLLRAAPWIAVRGNHETCKRNGDGYLLLLDPRLAGAGGIGSCADIVPPYVVNAGGKGFAVVDSSNASDPCTDTSCNSADYIPSFAALAQPGALMPNTWLLTHMPLWAVRKGPVEVTVALQKALPDGALPAAVSAVLSGHVHFWEALAFSDQRAPQFVLGNGGTSLAGKVKQDLGGFKFGNASVTDSKLDVAWGYTLFEGSGADWKAQTRRYGADAKTQGVVFVKGFECKLGAGTLKC